MGPRDIESLVEYISINFENERGSEPSIMVSSVSRAIYTMITEKRTKYDNT